jgi:hypothetical protein
VLSGNIANICGDTATPPFTVRTSIDNASKIRRNYVCGEHPNLQVTQFYHKLQVPSVGDRPIQLPFIVTSVGTISP